MDPLSPILDYASPRPRVKLRLPANSILRCTSNGRECLVEEKLAGRGGALAALCFAALVICVVMTTPLRMVQAQSADFAFPAVASLALIAMGMLVIRNTWRQTELRITDGEVTVTFSGPLTARRRYSWAAGAIGQIQVVRGEPPSGLGELRIIPDAGAEVHLFTDHRAGDLDLIAIKLNAAVNANAQPITTPPPTPA